MKIALAQVDANEFDRTSTARLARYLARAEDTDLVVFPESFPFWHDRNKAPSLADAKAELRERSTKGAPAFIAGGYVRQDRRLRNAAFLVHGGRVKRTYYKRFRWGEEGVPGDVYEIEPGTKIRKFQWGKFSCVPLICADVLVPRGKELRAMIEDAVVSGASPEVPVVVTSYGTRVRGAEWTRQLKAWARGCRAPVVFCNFAGRDRETGWGGGGSGVFWPDGKVTARPRKPGVYFHDF